jgi:histone H3/H4
MPKLPLAPFEKLLKESGAKRVSKPATKAFVRIVEDFGNELGKSASDFAKHANRKTVTEADILLAHKSRK